MTGEATENTNGANLADEAPRERVLPHPGSPEASAMMDSMLASYNWPANTKNAARAGWEAANHWLVDAELHGLWTPQELAAAKQRASEYADWFLTNAPPKVDAAKPVPELPQPKATYPLLWLHERPDLPAYSLNELRAYGEACFRAGTAAELARCADKLGALDCAHRCGVGAEMAAAVRQDQAE